MGVVLLVSVCVCVCRCVYICACMCVCVCILQPKASIINIPRWQQGGSPGTTQTGKGNSST